MIKFFTNDKIIFLITLAILIAITKNVYILDINSGGIVIFILGTALLSYLISICTTMIILILAYLFIRKEMKVNYCSLSFSKKIILIASTLDLYEENLDSVDTLVLYVHKNYQDNYE